MKRILALIIAMLVVISMFAGCAGSKQSGPGIAENEETKVQGDSQETKAGETKKEEPTKETSIRFITWTYADRPNTTDTFIKTAKEKLNVKIELENFPTAQYTEIIQTRISANDLPELVEMHTIDAPYILPAMKQSLMLPLNGIVPFDRFDPNAISANTDEKGNTYCITSYGPLMGVLYNRKVFADCGVTVPTNKDELYEVAEKIKAKGIAPFALGAKDGWSLHIIAVIAASEYALKEYSMMDAINKLKKGEIKLNSPGFVKAFSVQNEFRDKGWFTKNPLGTDVTAASAMIANGQAAMFIMGSWQVTAILDANPQADIGFFPLTLNEKGTKATVTTWLGGGVGAKASKDADKLEATKKAIQLYYSVETMTNLLNEFNGIPMHKDVKVDNSFLQEAVGYLNSSIVEASFELGLQPEQFDRFADCQAMLDGKMTVEAFLDKLQEDNSRQIK